MNRLSHICFITPEKTGRTALETVVRSVLEAGCRWIQLRRKGGTRRALCEEAGMVRELTSRYQALFIVNDHADIALAVDADGVHLGQDDLPLAVARRIMGDRIIGISTHALSEAVAAARGGADYIGFGPIFPTATKDAGNPQGPGALRPIIAAVRIPVIAIGGIAPGNAASVAVAGCRHVAVSSGIVTGDVVGNVKALTASLGCS